MNTETVRLLVEAAAQLAEPALAGVYEGMLVGAALWLVLKSFPRTNAATRHALLFAGLLTLALLPGIRVLQSASFLHAEGIAENSDSEIPVLIENTSNNQSEGLSTETVPSENLLSPVRSPFVERTWKVPVPNGLRAAVLLAWLAIALVRLGILTGQYVLLRRLKRRSLLPSPALQEIFTSASAQFRSRRKARLLVTDTPGSPVAAGFLHPAVLVPRGMENDPGIDAILRHELAHLVRRDDWMNLIQQVIRAIFFFDPAVLWISRRIAVEREIACDDHVIAANTSRRNYALFLTEFAGREHTRSCSAAPAAWSNSSQLKQRIHMILDTKRNASPRLAPTRAGFLAGAALILALAAVAASPRLAFADGPASSDESADSGPRHKDPAPPASTYVAPGAPVTFAEPSGGVVAVSGTAAAPARSAAPARVAKTGDDHDLERRLERLERMMRSLQKDKPDGQDFQYRRNFHFDFKGLPGSKEEDGRLLAELGKMKEARAKLKDGKEQWKQSQEDEVFARGMKDRIRLSFDEQRHALEAEHNALERQLKMIDKQLQRLDKQMEERDHDDRPDHPDRPDRDHPPRRKPRPDGNGPDARPEAEPAR